MADARNLESVRKVLQTHRTQIMSDYGAAGIGIGRAQEDATAYVLVAYMQTGGRIPKDTVVVEGIPLSFEITGEIKLQSDL